MHIVIRKSHRSLYIHDLLNGVKQNEIKAMKSTGWLVREIPMIYYAHVSQIETMRAISFSAEGDFGFSCIVSLLSIVVLHLCLMLRLQMVFPNTSGFSQFQRF